MDMLMIGGQSASAASAAAAPDMRRRTGNSGYGTGNSSQATSGTSDPPSTPIGGVPPFLFGRKFSESGLSSNPSFSDPAILDAAYSSLTGSMASTGSSTTIVASTGGSVMNNSSANQPVSLFASCMTLIEKLYSFPLFEFYLFPEGTSMFTDPDNPAMIEPIEILWGAFRLGAPLCMVYNHLNLTQPLKVSDVSGVRPGQYGKMCKDNVYHFVVACRNELHIAEAMDFIPSELYKNDTHGFMKVLKMVQEIVSRIEQSGNMPPKKPFPIPIPTFESAGTTSDNRSKLIKEMVDTERTYISALDTLQTYMKECEVQRVLSKDLIRLIFANLNDLIDFQRRFVITMESILVMPANEQRIGNLFIQNEENFSVYHSFCSNYNQAVKIVLDETENLKRLSNIIEPIQLQSYLIKPVQRVCRYPLLLQELIKLSDPEKYPYMDELKSGLESIKRVTETLNEESRRQENEQKKFDLRDRIDDWKGLNIDDFGELLLSEKFLMASSDQEREYDLFLFENILLCCKDMQQKAKKKKSTYSVRGNIQITAISRVEDISDASIGYYGIKVYWEDGLESVQFSLKCRNAEQVKLWKDRIDRLVHGSHVGGASSAPGSAFSRTSSSASAPVGNQRNWGRSLSGGAPADPNFAPYSGSGGMGRSGSIPNGGLYSAGAVPPYGYGDAYNLPRRQSNAAAALSRSFGSEPPASPLERRPTSTSPSPGTPNSGRAGSTAGVPPVPPFPQGMRASHGRQGSFASDAALDQYRRPSRQDSFPNGGANYSAGSSAFYINTAGGGTPGPTSGGSAISGATPITPGSSGFPSYQAHYSHNTNRPGNSSYQTNGNGPRFVPDGYTAATQATLAAAASGQVPPAGYSDDEATDEEDFGGNYRTPASQLRSRPSVSGPGASASLTSPPSRARTVNGPPNGATSGLPSRFGSDSSYVSRPSTDGNAQQPQQSSHHLPRESSFNRPGPQSGGNSNQFPLPPRNSSSVASAAAAAASNGSGATGTPAQLATHHAAPPALRRTPTAPLPFSNSWDAASSSTDPIPPLPSALLAAASAAPSGSSQSSNSASSAAPSSNSSVTSFIKIKTHYNADIFLIAVPLKNPSYADLVTRLERKIRLCGGVSPQEQGRKMWIGFKSSKEGSKDEEEVVPVEDDKDVQRAFNEAVTRGGGTLNLFVS